MSLLLIPLLLIGVIGCGKNEPGMDITLLYGSWRLKHDNSDLSVRGYKEYVFKKNMTYIYTELNVNRGVYNSFEGKYEFDSHNNALTLYDSVLHVISRYEIKQITSRILVLETITLEPTKR
ncbi:hypothetical protein [Porphyromonas pogonae]|uniref:hypothetical protein n=1 Tax=Porphyromonas pogonae TaxID=867595 RepID=UPI002E797EEF|nr:hypothetical protein [Porphyromonas pogonae]